MAINKFTCPPQASGQGSFSDNLVGLQLVDGGGLTQANFAFTTNITEKQDRNFEIGSFSDPISLDTMNISNVEESKMIIANNFQVYPNYDLSQVTNFTLYGSLVLRFSASIKKIINFFPAALEVTNPRINYLTGTTAINIVYNSVENETKLELELENINNPFGIDFTVNAEKNFQATELSISTLRNLKTNYSKYVVIVDDKHYPINEIVPVTNGDQVLTIYVEGNAFSGNSVSYDNIIVRPSDFYVNKVFNEDFDEVENFLLNRNNTPIYTSYFSVPMK